MKNRNKEAINRAVELIREFGKYNDSERVCRWCRFMEPAMANGAKDAPEVCGEFSDDFLNPGPCNFELNKEKFYSELAASEKYNGDAMELAKDILTELGRISKTVNVCEWCEEFRREDYNEDCAACDEQISDDENSGCGFRLALDRFEREIVKGEN